MKTERGWAIVGDHGLYIGFHFIRREMIAQHIGDIYGVQRFCLGSKLNRSQVEAWHKCQRKGDRAVKVKISYERT